MINWIRELWRYRELFIALTEREIKVRYKQTILGVLWAILQPASLTLIFTIVFSFILKVDSGSVPYPVFAYSALLPWTFFSSAVSFGALSVVNNGNLVTKVYFPREILPLSNVGAALFDFLMASLVFAGMLFFYHVPVTSSIFMVLFITPLIFILTTGISFFLSALNVLFRDIRFAIPLLLQVWLYITPVIYATGQIPDRYQLLIRINPLVPLIESFRMVTIYGKMPNLVDIALSLIFSVVIFVIGYWFFKNKEKIFADVI